MNRLTSKLPVVLIFLVLLASCAGPQKTVYFRTDTQNDTSVVSQAMVNEVEGVVQPDDILSISITSISSITVDNPVGIFKEGGTQLGVSAIGGGGISQITGYLVDKGGFIDYPVVGKIAVSGQTIRQIKSIIATRLRDYVKDPVVEVRIVNFKITVLGEVTRPGNVLAPNHKLSIIEAISAAGDIPISGRKENVLVIRENNGKREFARLNLNSRDVFNSPFYYLKQNDIVYVEPNKIRRQEGNTFTKVYLPVFATLLSVALAVYGIVQIVNSK